MIGRVRRQSRQRPPNCCLRRSDGRSQRRREPAPKRAPLTARRRGGYPILRLVLIQPVNRVRFDRGNSNQYMLNWCYAMEHVRGAAIKLGAIPKDSRPEHIKRALNAFCQAGIHHLTDASVFSPDDPVNFKFIDFAIEEFEVAAPPLN